MSARVLEAVRNFLFDEWDSKLTTLGSVEAEKVEATSAVLIHYFEPCVRCTAPLPEFVAVGNAAHSGGDDAVSNEFPGVQQTGVKRLSSLIDGGALSLGGAIGGGRGGVIAANSDARHSGADHG